MQQSGGIWQQRKQTFKDLLNIWEIARRELWEVSVSLIRRNSHKNLFEVSFGQGAESSASLLEERSFEFIEKPTKSKGLNQTLRLCWGNKMYKRVNKAQGDNQPYRRGTKTLQFFCLFACLWVCLFVSE